MYALKPLPILAVIATGDTGTGTLRYPNESLATC